MSAFSSRTTAYKIAVGLLFLATAMYIAGVGAPYWVSTETAPQTSEGYTLTYLFNEGLWMLCITADVAIASATGCGNYGISGLTGWFHAVRALEVLGLCGLVIACIYALATNCCRTFPGPRTRTLEILAALSGCVAFCGCMVYVGMMLDKRGNTDITMTDYVGVFFPAFEWDFDWALYLAAIGSGLSVIAAIVIAVGNKPVEDPPNTAGMVMTTVTAQPGYAPQPYVGGATPGAPPQPYVVQPGYTPEKAGYPAAY